MFFIEILFALLMAFIFTLIFAVGFRRPGPWSSIWAFFAVIFLASWAGGLWISQIGPAFAGIYWLPIILVSFIFALLLASFVPGSRRRPKVDTISQVEQEETAKEKVFDVFFWIFLVSFLVIIILGYFVPNRGIIVTKI
jgi:hypothetical protein